jgi:hypothetical protein
VNNGSNYTLYQEFVTEGDIQELNITWKQSPYGFNATSYNYRTERTVISTTLRASLVFWDIQVWPDDGAYTVTASNECGASNESVLRLHVVETCFKYPKPEPVRQHNTTVLAEPEIQGAVQLTATFHGPNSGDYRTEWKEDDSVVCTEYSNIPLHFRCNQSVMFLVHCMFVANLWILSPSYTSSGQYSVYSIYSDGTSSNSTIDLHIVRQPHVVSCTTGPPRADRKGCAQFVCQVSNYSEFVRVSVVENDKKQYNKSTEDLSFGCEAGVVNLPATCTVNISTSSLPSGKREYRLCAGYNGSVAHAPPPKCSDNIKITVSGNSGSENLRNDSIAGGSVVVVALLLLVISVAACVVYRRRNASVSWGSAVQTGPGTPLLHSTEQEPYLKTTSPKKPRTRTQEYDDITETDHQPSGDNTNTIVQSPGGRPTTPLWKTVRGGPLQREELVHVAKAVRHWACLARYLGLPEPVIVAISEDHRGNYEEQKFQMLLKWYTQQPKPPSKQALVRIVEEKMRDPVLTQDIVNILGTDQALSV